MPPRLPRAASASGGSRQFARSKTFDQPMTIRRRALLAVPAAALVVHEPARAKNPGLAQAVMPTWRLKISAQHPRLLIRPHEVDAFGAFVRSSDAAKSLATALKRLDLDADRLLPPQEPSAEDRN